MLGLLLKNRFRMFTHAFLRGETKQRIRRLMLLVVWIVFLVVIFTSTHNFLNVLIQLPDNGLLLVNRIISMVFFILLIMLLLSGMTISLHFVFLSSDLRLLLSTPISRKQLFSYKFIESVSANSTLFLYLGLPVIIAYGTVTNAPLGYYPFALFISLVFLTVPTGLAIVIAMLSVRFVPANRAKDVLTAIMALIFISVWAGLQFIRIAVFDRTSAAYDPNAVNMLQAMAMKPFLNWIPSNMVADGLAASAKGNWLGAFSGLMVLVFISAIFYIISMVMIEGAHRRDLIGTEQLGVRLGRRPRKKTPSLTWVPSTHTFVFWGTIARDFRLFTRDMRHLSQLMVIVVMMVLFPFLMSRKSSELPVQWAMYYPYFFVLLFEGFAATSIAAKLVPLESKAFWLSKISPRPMRNHLWGKLALAFSVCTLLGWFAVTISAVFYKSSLSTVLIVMLACVSVSFGVSGLAIGVGAFFPKFDWDHPKRMLTGSGGLILNLCMLLYLGLSVGIFAIGSLVSRMLGGSIISTGLSGVVMTMIAAATLTIIGIQVAHQRLERLEWFF